MKPKSKISKVATGLIAVGGVTFLTGCDTEEIQAIVAGVELAADTLIDLDSSHDDDGVSFGDWLLDELRN